MDRFIKLPPSPSSFPLPCREQACHFPAGKEIFRFLGFRIILVMSIVIIFFVIFPERLLSAQEIETEGEKNITLDFDNIDLPVFVKFISELIGKNFVIDERVRGKVTIFSPAKISIDEAYKIFLSVLHLKGFDILPSQEIIQIVPGSEIEQEKNINIYQLENANAEDIVKVLVGLISKVPSRRTQSGRRRGSSRPKGQFEGSIQILSDKPTNSLIITATKNDYEKLKDVIKELDVKRGQVYVEAVIMEIGLDKLREIGVEFRSTSGFASNKLTAVGGTNFGGINLATEGPAGLANLSGLAVGAIKGTFRFRNQEFLNIGGLLRTLQSDADINILSTPQLLAADNQKAEIVVGQNVPFITGQSQTAGGNVQTTIERKDVGITLRLTPQIMENDIVKLDIFQEISTVSDTPQSVGTLVVGPTTNKRSATTTVMIKDRQTIVIGGLIKDNILKSERKVPFLGDIPFLGWLFRFQSKRIEKTNLLIFLTPYIVRESHDVASIKKEKEKEMKEFIEESQVEGWKKRGEVFEDR
ncbi:MAG: secretin N-terminal domain-containing protein [Nitrospirota bacterium]